MLTFNVYLANPYGMRYWWTRLVHDVRALFIPALSAPFEDVVVQNTMGRPSVSSRELLIYVVPNQGRSVVARAFNVKPGGGGTTAWKGGVTGSEVYVNDQDTQRVAYLVFHEALHNKLGKTDRQLHTNSGLSADPIRPPLSGWDIGQMKRGMARSVPQWLHGWDVAFDPLANP